MKLNCNSMSILHCLRKSHLLAGTLACTALYLLNFIMPPLLGYGTLSDDARLTSVCLTSICLSRTSGLSREQRGLGRLKLAQS